MFPKISVWIFSSYVTFILILILFFVFSFLCCSHKGCLIFSLVNVVLLLPKTVFVCSVEVFLALKIFCIILYFTTSVLFKSCVIFLCELSSSSFTQTCHSLFTSSCLWQLEVGCQPSSRPPSFPPPPFTPDPPTVCPLPTGKPMGPDRLVWAWAESGLWGLGMAGRDQMPRETGNLSWGLTQNNLFPSFLMSTLRGGN